MTHAASKVQVLRPKDGQETAAIPVIIGLKINLVAR